VNERERWRGLVDAKIASSVELLEETLDFGREVGEERWKPWEREGAGVQGHALSQIINFSPLGDSKRIYVHLAKTNQWYL